MHLRITIYLLILCLSIIKLYSANNINTDAKTTALANIKTVVVPAVFMYNNIALSGEIEKKTFGIHASNPYLINGIRNITGSATIPLKSERFTIGVQSYGMDIYQRQTISIGFSHVFRNKLSLGFQANQLSQIVQEYGVSKLWFVNLGMLYPFNEKTKLGVLLTNPTLGIENEQVTVSSAANIGISYQSSQQVLLLLELEKNLGSTPIIKAAMEYAIFQAIFIRLGVTSKPTFFSFGLGANWKQLQFNLANSYHPTLGNTPHLTLSYAFKKKTSDQ